MSLISLPRVKQRIITLRQVIGVGIFLFSIVIMMIWIVDPKILILVLPQSATEKFNTALLFALCALHSLSTTAPLSSLKRWTDSIPFIIILISGVTLLATLTSTSLFLDQLIADDPLTAPDALPGQMSGMTSFLFLLMGIAYLVNRKSTLIAEQLGIFVNLIALVAVFAFLFDFEALYSIGFFSTVSIFTGLQFVLLSMIFVLSLEDGIIHNLVTRDNPAGIVARRLFPAMLLLPASFGWLTLQGVNRGLYQPTFALVLLVMLTIVTQFLMLIMHTAALQRWYFKNKLLQQQLLDQEIERLELENIREINQLKEEFFAQLTHDMRSPLTTILLSSDIIMQYQDKLTSVQRVKHLEKIRYQALSMLDFVDDLVLLSQFQLTTIPCEPTSENIIDFVQTYYDEFVNYNEVAQHNITLVLPDTAVYVDFDTKLMRRLLNNLMSNAIKYSPTGGTIVLKLETFELRTELSVADEGIGIPADNIDTLYDLFSRADNVEKIGGYGLGLAIVKKVVDAHNATISVDSTVGQGTTFTVTLNNVFEPRTVPDQN